MKIPTQFLVWRGGHRKSPVGCWWWTSLMQHQCEKEGPEEVLVATWPCSFPYLQCEYVKLVRLAWRGMIWMADRLVCSWNFIKRLSWGPTTLINQLVKLSWLFIDQAREKRNPPSIIYSFFSIYYFGPLDVSQLFNCSRSPDKPGRVLMMNQLYATPIWKR